jgi:hypothetical protein
MRAKIGHVDIGPGVIGHGEFDSGVYFDRGGPRAARFGFFLAPQRELIIGLLPWPAFGKEPMKFMLLLSLPALRPLNIIPSASPLCFMSPSFVPLRPT